MSSRAAGGLAVGLKRAGFRIAAAVEIEPHSFATYKANPRSEVEVRRAKAEERPRRDAWMDAHPDPGFRRLAGRGLRSIAAFRGPWLGLAAWPNGAFACGPRDRWIGGKPAQPFRRLEWLANPTRFLVRSGPGWFPNRASFFRARRTRRRADDGRATPGHRVLGTETFRDPKRVPGTRYRAAGWKGLGRTRGFARAHGPYTDPPGTPKERFRPPLRPDARALLARPQPRPPDLSITRTECLHGKSQHIVYATAFGIWGTEDSFFDGI